MAKLFLFGAGKSASLLGYRCRYQLLATISICIITFAHGLGVGWLSPTLPILQSADSPLDFKVTIEEGSWLGSMLGLGSLLGNIVVSLLLERGGRKLCLYLIAFPNICIWILIYFAKNVTYLYVARLFCGFTSGAGYLVMPIFVSEIADINIRGSLSSLMMLSVNFGVLVGFIMCTHLNYFVVPCLAIFLPIAYFAACLFLPETAPQLLRKGKVVDAETSYVFYKNLRNETESNYHQDFEELKTVINKSQQAADAKLSFKDFITKPAIKGFGSAIILSLGYQFSGVFSFINYMSDIFARSGSIVAPNTATIIMGAVQIVGVYTSTIFVDIVGRRILMLISTLGLGIGCICFGCFTYFAHYYDLTPYNWLPLILMMCMIYLGNIGLIGIFFVVLIEVFPVKIRSVATSISVIILSSLIFVTLKLFPLLMHHYGVSITMWFSAIAALLTFVYFFVFLQETKGKSMIED